MLMLLRRLLRPPPSHRGLQAPPALADFPASIKETLRIFPGNFFFSGVAVKMAAFSHTHEQVLLMLRAGGPGVLIGCSRERRMAALPYECRSLFAVREVKRRQHVC